MASVSITIPNPLVPRLAAAMRATFPAVEGEDDAAMFKRITADYWRGVLVEHEARQAEAVAWAAQRAAVVAAKEAAATDGAGIG